MTEQKVLPARAGMSPERTPHHDRAAGAPRTGGDEPVFDAIFNLVGACSPHGRG